MAVTAVEGGRVSAGSWLPQPVYRLSATPRPNPDESEPDVVRRRPHILAALVGAYLAGESLTTCWIRTGAFRQISVLLGGATVAAGAPEEDGAARLLFPPGSEGRRLHAEEERSLLEQLPQWVSCEAVFDTLHLTREKEDPWSESWGSLEEVFAHLAHIGLAWLVIARPARRERVAEESKELAMRLPELRDRAARSEQHRVEVERLEAWYRELERATPTGLWQLHVLAGGATAEDAHRVASMLCNTAEIRELPFRLRPAGDSDTLQRQLGTDHDPSSAALVSSELVAAITRPPLREVPGVRLVQPPPFDVTSESSGPFRLGQILDEGLRRCGRLTISRSTLNRHAFVCGATGSGKSQTVRTLLETVARSGIPWMVIEPAKAEYGQAMAGRLDGHAETLVIRIGDPSAVPACLNPLESEPGFPLQSHADMIRALFLAAFDADEPFPQVLTYALNRCYGDRGFDLALSRPVLGWPGPEPPQPPTLGDLQTAAKQVVAEIGYSQEITDNVRGFVDVRLGSLRTGTPGRFFEGGHPLDFGALLTRPVVFEMEDVASDQDKAFVMGTILIRLFEHLRVRTAAGASGGGATLEHVTVVEEAHRLLRHAEPGTPAAQAIELFANLLAEIRAYGEGIVVAEQIPSKVIPDLIKNTALKIVHRLPAEDDRRAVGATMNLTNAQSEYVVTLVPGRAAVFADGMDRPVLAAVEHGEARETGTPSKDPPLAGTRSACCVAACRAEPCNLEQIRRAEQLIAERPDLELWIELLYLAHVTGLTGYIGRPDARWLEDLRAEQGDPEDRLIGCAIARCADRSKDARYPYLRQFYPPERLATHVSEVALTLIAAPDATYPCSGPEPEWQAGCWRWQDVKNALDNGGGDHDEPHPLTAEWRARELTLPDARWDEQLAALSRHRSWRFPQQRELELGAEPVRIIQLVQELTGVATVIADDVRTVTEQIGLSVDPYFYDRIGIHDVDRQAIEAAGTGPEAS